MKYPVLKKFRDRGSGEIYEIGSEYPADTERAAGLQALGFLGQIDDKQTTKRTPRGNTSKTVISKAEDES
ncbi:hypothetical protein [Paenibacillus graminis]|uniref:Uncharacterized protein n=1 Tax=Paenibacillus graminis TaxID=189425 RepID=A0A089MB05_9BACL|nr:hypothetical protein [Paenibacillus graminis]AIQ69540.1 hypothetical protein PGRAT_19305 [Paenibacillus graminis]